MDGGELDPVQLLMAEHDHIMSAEAIINSLDQSWEQDPKKYEDNSRELIVFFKEYGDQYHHHKEEEVLFPAMVNHLDFQQHEIIEELEEHHQLFRETINEIVAKLDLGEWQSAQELMNKYINLLLDHISAENDEVFMMAQTLFNEVELERMYFQFQDIDSALGMDKKLKFEEMLTQLT